MTQSNTPLDHKQLAHWVVERLRSEIMEGRLKPGEWLRQQRFAQEHGVSEMPIREAFKQLAAEGLVEHVPYRGVRVVQFSPADVEDLYTCRAFIESMAAHHSAVHVSDDELSLLQSLHLRMIKCETPRELREYRDLNRQFHAVIFNSSKRSYLVRTLAQLWAAFPTMLWSNIPHIAVVSVPGRDEADAAEHQEIVDALAAHDPKRAERAVRYHIETAGNALIAAMKAQQ